MNASGVCLDMHPEIAKKLGETDERAALARDGVGEHPVDR
ncbi:hypothetical protein AB0I68_34910 [Streptomyces sp. NPDC050448]